MQENKKYMLRSRQVVGGKEFDKKQKMKNNIFYQWENRL